jgi:hypothetical protein
MDTALPSVQTRVLSTALLAAAFVVGCGDDATTPGAGWPVNQTPGAVGAGQPDAGSVTPPANTPPATTGGGTAPVVPTNPTGGGTPTAMQPTTGGGSLDTPWCKTKAILTKRCVDCHSTSGGTGPFPLETHAHLVAAHPSKPGKKVYERVGVRIHATQSQAEGLGVMPPGKEMAADELATIDAWVKAGAPAGENPTCTPPAGTPTTPTEAAVWPPAECDAVYKITAHGAGGLDTPAMAPPGVESHPQVAWDAPWGDEKVQAIAFKTITDNKDVLHHWILSGRPGGFLTGWAPGEDGVRMMKPDIGMLMPTGKGSLNLDMHYFNTMGTVAKPDKSGVEICVVKQAKFRKNNASVTMSLASIGDFLGGGLAPANTTNHEAKATCTVGGTQPITLLSASPHAHKYAVRMRFVLTRKGGGEPIVMHDEPFMFGEQKSYSLDPPVVVMPGDVITTSCFFTNKTSRNISFGESTESEMCFNFAMYYPAGALTCSGGGGLIGGGGGSGGGFVTF